MKILIVEDSPTDRDLLKYLLEDRFQKEAKFREATSLKGALTYLAQGDIDCVILDLQLPDSVGKETFNKITKEFPAVPIIVMTHNKDRNLALEMIQQGAADYILKNFTNEEELFRRVLFAIEKHQTTIRVPPKKAASIRRLESQQIKLRSAHASGEMQAIKQSTFETTDAVVEITRLMFTEIQKMNKSVESQGAVMEGLRKTVDKLNTEILEGPQGQPSLKSKVLSLEKVVEDLERHNDDERVTQVEIEKVVIANRGKIIVAVISILGTVLASGVAWYVSKMLGGN